MFTGMNLLTFIDIILWILLTGTITNLPFTLERARVDFNLKWSVVLLCKGHAETLIESPLRNAEAFSIVPLNRIKSIWIRKKKILESSATCLRVTPSWIFGSSVLFIFSSFNFLLLKKVIKYLDLMKFVNLIQTIMENWCCQMRILFNNIG